VFLLDAITLADFAGAVGLVCLRRSAPFILSVAFAANLINEAIVGTFVPRSDVSPIMSLIWLSYPLIGLCVSTLIVAYAWRLAKRGILR
jgi:hypothetical protein